MSNSCSEICITSDTVYKKRDKTFLHHNIHVSCRCELSILQKWRINQQISSIVRLPKVVFSKQVESRFFCFLKTFKWLEYQHNNTKSSFGCLQKFFVFVFYAGKLTSKTIICML